MKLVEAQEGRRILDRLVGWETSPVLWRVFGRGQAASAGRVQSVAVRMVVERERARMRSAPGSGTTSKPTLARARPARSAPSLVELDGKRARRRPRLRSRDRRDRRADGQRRRAARRRRGRRRSPTGCATSPFAVASRRVRSVHRAAARAVHHVDAAAGVGPQAAVTARAHDGGRAAALRARATSPTCEPTARTCRSRRSPRPAPRSASSTARSTCPPSRARTAAR